MALDRAQVREQRAALVEHDEGAGSELEVGALAQHPGRARRVRAQAQREVAVLAALEREVLAPLERQRADELDLLAPETAPQLRIEARELGRAGRGPAPLGRPPRE